MSAAPAPAQAAVAPISEPWSQQASWTVLDTGFADARHFLALWQHWRLHTQRPAMLHYVGVLSLAEASALPGLLASVAQTPLAALCYDLEPGFQRLLLEDGQLSLTLCVGATSSMLARQVMQADSLLVSPFADETGLAQAWDKWQIKALARCCKRGALLQLLGDALPGLQLLADAGFTGVVAPAGRTPVPLRPGMASLDSAAHRQAVYAPRWQARARGHHTGTGMASLAPPPHTPANPLPQRCAVIGAGIAGASVARALALRGWTVEVYEAQAGAAPAASGLPVGLVVPHHSADDSPRSRLSRFGTRLMLQHAKRLLQEGQDWSPSGVLERTLATTGLAPAEAELLSSPAARLPANGWSHPVQYGGAAGLWHAHAAWIKPRRLVQRWLEHARIRLHSQAAVHTLQRVQGAGQTQWLLRDPQGQELGRAERVVFANAYGCVALLQRLAQSAAASPESAAGVPWVEDVLAKLQAMQNLHGTLSYGPVPAAAMPAFPVNGHGSFVAGVPTAQGPYWYAGATFQSDSTLHADLAQEHAANYQKLQTLLPEVAQALAAPFASPQLGAWQGSRCIAHDRLPLVGPLDEAPEPTLWLCAGMGARGLSFSALCAELLAAWLGGEPLPLESTLARSLDTRRARRNRGVPAVSPASPDAL